MDPSEGSVPVRVADLLPGFTVVRESTTHRKLRLGGRVEAVLENNLTRKGLWATDGGRPAQQETLHFESEDVVGRLVIDAALGRLTVFEMELVSWILGRWFQQEDPQNPWVGFSLKQVAGDFGVGWSGARGAFIKDALRRIDRVRFTAEVWSEVSRTLVTDHFGIFDRVRIIERKGTRGSPVLDGSVRVKIGDFFHQQLQLGQFHRYSWLVLRGALSTPLAKRLYVFLDGQRGRPVPGGMLYEHIVDERLLVSLGVRDRNAARVRANLRKACSEITHAERRYVNCHVRESPDGWVVSALRA